MIATAPPLTASAPRPAHVLSANDLEPWLDGMIPAALNANRVAGAVVVVVKDGQVLLARGYGFADIGKRIPVDPDRTLFRPGSISKLFVWTAIMQLAETGQLDLDADINNYLDFRIVGKAGKKITIRNLMTHTAGFEETGKSVIVDDPTQIFPVDQYLKRYTPAPIFQPGSTPAYSNYGSAIAGYIVQRVSKMSFDDYVERKIFAPLEMKRASFHQPVPAPLKRYLSVGYTTSLESPRPEEFVNTSAIGGLSVSGSEFAHFMIAQLNGGAFGKQRILSAESANTMHRVSFSGIAGLDGMALGFQETNINGRRVVGHAGNSNWFHSDLHLFLDDGVGIFISLNSTGIEASDIRQDLFWAFADRYFPDANPQNRIDQNSARQYAEMVSGTYLSSRRIESNFGKVNDLFSEATLTPSNDGDLIFDGHGKTARFAAVAPYLWQEVGGKNMLGFSIEDGRVARMSISSLSPTIVFQPIPLITSTTFVVSGFVCALGFLILSLASSPIPMLIRRKFSAPRAYLTGELVAVRARSVGALVLLFSAIAWAALLLKAGDGMSEHDNVQIIATQLLSICCALVAVGCASVSGWWTLRHSTTRLHKLGSIAWFASVAFILVEFYNYNLFKIGSQF